MLTRKAITAYCCVCSLALLALVTGWHAMQIPWLKNGKGEGIGLWKIVTENGSEEFPGRHVCKSHPSFCASWRTATFLLTLAVVPEALALLALMFSWAFHHRKKTVVVVRYLLISALTLETCGLLLWLAAFPHIRHVLGSKKWKLVSGWPFVLISGIANACLFVLMIHFRSIVRKNSISLDDEVYDSDDEDNDARALIEDNADDDISVPDTVPPEQIDFYIFNKRARRRELARLATGPIR